MQKNYRVGKEHTGKCGILVPGKATACLQMLEARKHTHKKKCSNNSTISPKTVLHLDLQFFCFAEYKDGLEDARFVKERHRRQTKTEDAGHCFSLFLDNWRISEDSHTYYTSQVYQSLDLVNNLWIDLGKSSIHQTLTDSHRTAINFQLLFNFTFYGHTIGNVVIATGRFLYISDLMHKWISSTQYIAPLMANFDPNIGGNQSLILYKSLESMFVVEWRDVYLQEQNSLKDTPFTFQCILYPNGTIVFLYQKVPIQVPEISPADHPVKVGLSDAYYTVSNVFGMPQTTVYEYHRVVLNQSVIQEGNIIVLTPLPTCNVAINCESCITQTIAFNCSWCSIIKRCPDGLDRHRQNWLNNCSNRTASDTCPSTTSSSCFTAKISMSTLHDKAQTDGFNVTTPSNVTTERFMSTRHDKAPTDVFNATTHSNITTERSVSALHDKAQTNGFNVTTPSDVITERSMSTRHDKVPTGVFNVTAHSNVTTERSVSTLHNKAPTDVFNAQHPLTSQQKGPCQCGMTKHQLMFLTSQQDPTMVRQSNLFLIVNRLLAFSQYADKGDNSHLG